MGSILSLYSLDRNGGEGEGRSEGRVHSLLLKVLAGHRERENPGGRETVIAFLGMIRLREFGIP